MADPAYFATWSKVSVERYEALTANGPMKPAGKAVAELVEVSAAGRRLPRYDWQEKS